MNKTHSDSELRAEREEELRNLQARMREAMLAAAQEKDVRLMTFLDGIETQVTMLLGKHKLILGRQAQR